MGLSVQEKKMLIDCARGAVTDFLERGVLDDVVPPFPDPRQALHDATGVFVAIYHDGKLRGCMGLPTALLPLWQACRVCARNAACKDPRFLPLAMEELPHVSFEITLMGEARPFEDVSQVLRGNCLLVLEKGFRREAFMPKMIKEAPGDREEIMRYLRDKVSIDADGDDAPETWTVYEAEVFVENDF